MKTSTVEPKEPGSTRLEEVEPDLTEGPGFGESVPVGAFSTDVETTEDGSCGFYWQHAATETRHD